MASRATGQAPFEFRWDDGILVNQPDETHTRRLIFELFEQHRAKGAVARILNESKYQTRRNSNWSDTAVSRQLTCMSAIGIYAINKTRVDESGKRIERPKEEWEYVECEQIIPTETWDRVHGILQEQKEKQLPPGKSPTTTFAGFLKCTCGGSMAISSGSLKYSCRDCDNRIPSNDLEEIFQSQFRHLIETRPDLFGDLPSSDESVAEAEENLTHAQEKLSTIKREMSKFELLFAKSEISLERFSEVHGPLDTERDSLTKEISRLRSVCKNRKAQAPEEEEFDLSFIADEWFTLTLNEKREIVSSLLNQIVIGNGEIEFRYSFPENLEEFSKDAPVSQQTNDPTNGLPREPGDPLYMRLPSPGSRCELTGMSRSKLNELILANDRNSYRPPVRSISIKLPGKTRGTRLIVWSSLKQYLANQERTS